MVELAKLMLRELRPATVLHFALLPFTHDMLCLNGQSFLQHLQNQLVSSDDLLGFCMSGMEAVLLESLLFVYVAFVHDMLC